MPDTGKDRKQNEGTRRKTLPPALIGRGGFIQSFSNCRHIDIPATLQGFQKCDANHTLKYCFYVLRRVFWSYRVINPAKIGDKVNTTTSKKKATSAADIFAKPAKSENLSTITKALEEAHAIIAKENNAPRATIVTGRSSTVHGHFTPWTPWASGEETFHEIFITISKRTARELLGTLLHETAHSIDNKEGVRGTSGDGYHNQKFKARAEGLGLTITQAPRIGFSVTTVTDECAARWAEPLRLIEEALRLTADNDGGTAKPKGRNKNLLKAICKCSTIRASASVIAAGVTCDSCGAGFVKA